MLPGSARRWAPGSKAGPVWRQRGSDCPRTRSLAQTAWRAGRSSVAELERDIEACFAAQDIVGDDVADLVVETNERVELPGAEVERFAVDAEDDVVDLDAGLSRGRRHEIALTERQRRSAETERLFFLGCQVVAVDL